MTNTHKHAAFAARLKLALDREGVPVLGRYQWVAEVIEVTKTMAGFAVVGRNLPRYEKTALLAHRLQVRHEWLRTGKGPMADGVPAPMPLAEPMMLVWMPANSIPDNATAAAGAERMVRYEDYLTLAARLTAAEAKVGPPPPPMRSAAKRRG